MVHFVAGDGAGPAGSAVVNHAANQRIRLQVQQVTAVFGEVECFAGAVGAFNGQGNLVAAEGHVLFIVGKARVNAYLVIGYGYFTAYYYFHFF